MRTSSTIAFTLFAASASPVFGAPVVLSNFSKSHDAQLFPRIQLPSLNAVGKKIAKVFTFSGSKTHNQNIASGAALFLATVAAGTAVIAGAVGIGAVATRVFGVGGVDSSHVDFSSIDGYAAVSNGAIPETDQRQLLAAIEQKPDSYPAIMQQVRDYKGITEPEITLFENADPAKGDVKRSILELD